MRALLVMVILHVRMVKPKKWALVFISCLLCCFVLEAKDNKLQKNAALALLEQDINPTQLLLWLYSEDIRLNRKALRIISKLEQKPIALIPDLIKMLSHESAIKRKLACQILGALKNPSVEINSALIKALNDSNLYVVDAAIDALGQFGKDAKDAIPRLQKLLKRGDSQTKTSAAVALARIAPQGPEDMKPLIDLLQDDSVPNRENVVLALRHFPQYASKTVHALRKAALTDPDEEVGGASVEAIGWFAQTVSSNDAHIFSEIILEMVKLIRGPRLNAQVTEVLDNIGSKLNVPFSSLIETAKDQSALEASRINAIIVLRSMGKKIRPTFSELIAIAQDENEPQALRVTVALTLKSIGGYPSEFRPKMDLLIHKGIRYLVNEAISGKYVKKTSTLDSPNIRPNFYVLAKHLAEERHQAVKLLMDGLKSGIYENRANTVEALFDLGWPGNAAFGPLTKALLTPDLKVRSRIIKTLVAWGKADNQTIRAKILPQIRREIYSKDFSERLLGIQTAGLLYDIAPGVVNLLQPLTHNKNNEIRAEAARALMKAANHSKAALTSLFVLLKDRDPNVQKAAYDSLIVLENKKKTGFENIDLLLKSKNDWLKTVAVRLIAKWDIHAAIKTLEKWTTDQNKVVQLEASIALATLTGEKDLNKVFAFLLDTDVHLRRRAVEGLFWFTHFPSLLIKPIQTAFQDEDQEVKLIAIWVCKRLGSYAFRLKDDLQKLIQSQDEAVKVAAAQALLFIGRESETKEATRILASLKRGFVD